MGVNILPKTVTRQRRGCDLNPGPFAPESSTLTTWVDVLDQKHTMDRSEPDQLMRQVQGCLHWRQIVHSVANPRTEDG